MKHKLPRLILILLIVALSFAMLACSNDQAPDDTPPITDGGNGDGTQQGGNPINKSEIFAEIKDGLVNAGTSIAETKTGSRYVASKYTFIANSVNMSLEYEANYDLDRIQDSEIMVRAYNYNMQANTAFVYYVNNTLYYAIGDTYRKVDDFGGSSTFTLFYEMITQLDFEQTLFSVDIAEKIESMAALAETNLISKIILSEDLYNITVTDINLDDFKTTVNDFIKENGAAIGSRFDALTNAFFGFNLSDLKSVQIGRFNLNELLTVFEKDVNGDPRVSDLHINFAGNQMNNIDSYYFDIEYSTKYNEIGPINLTRDDDPDTNNYIISNTSEINMVGSLFVPYFDQTFSAEVKAEVSMEDNLANKIFVEFVNRTENQGGSFSMDELFMGAYYKDGKLYVDADGLLDDYIGSFVEYEALGFPRLEIKGFDLTHNLQKILEKVLDLAKQDFAFGSIVGGTTEEGEETTANQVLKTLFNKVWSKDGKFFVLIDKEFVLEVLGESSGSVVAMIADTLGMEEGLVRDIIGLGYFDELALQIGWNTLTGDFEIIAYNGETELFVLTLNREEVPQGGLDIDFPDEDEVGYFETFEEFTNPAVINAHIEGTLRTQGAENKAIGALMGLFVGDISGKNSPYTMSISDKLQLSLDLWQANNEFYVRANVLLNGTPIVDVYSDVANPDTLLINNHDLGVKYTMPRAEVVTLLTALTNNKNAWTFETIVDALEIFVSEAHTTLRDNDVLVQISPYTLNGEKHDPLNEIFGIENFIAELAVSINFAAPEFSVDASEYVVPHISIVDEVVAESIYKAQWVESAIVSFGDTHIEFALTFEGDSAKHQTGVYEYHPEAKLFGQTVKYTLYITDTVNGTNVVESLYDNQLIIDPSAENAVPDKMKVVYTNGVVGELDYEIVGFPYNNSNIKQLMAGMRPAEYELIIGKNSMAERRFIISVEVLGRNLKERGYGSYNNVPIVAQVVIDPYQYSIEKRKEASLGREYYPFKYWTEEEVEKNENIGINTLVLDFYRYPGTTETHSVYLDKFNWNFDESKITYAGGEYNVIGKYQTIDIAIEIIIECKEVSYIQINDNVRGFYTIDSLVKETYTIPTKTDVATGTEIRVYFTNGDYRIIGQEPQGYVQTDAKCDGYYDVELAWSIPYADYVTIDRSIHPLNNGRTNITTTSFGDNIAGRQDISLTVECPTRVIGKRDDSVVSYTSIVYDERGAIDEALSTIEAVKASLATFYVNGNVNTDYFEYDPYRTDVDNVCLPTTVYVYVRYEGKDVLRGYPVTWILGEDNIIDNVTDGSETLNNKILNSFANETYLRVYGVIGNGELTQTLEMVIHNKSARYQNIVMLDDITTDGDKVVAEVVTPNVIERERLGEKEYFIENLNPYLIPHLPKHVKLQFPEASGIADKLYKDVKWYIEEAGEQLDIEEYVVNPAGGSLVVYANIVDENSNDNLLGQRVSLNLIYRAVEIDPEIIYGISDYIDGHIIDKEGNTIPYVELDIYEEYSQELYNKLVTGIDKVGVSFGTGEKSDINIPITWLNIDDVLKALQSPEGASAYENNIISLRGIIREGTEYPREVSLGFLIKPMILGSMNFRNFNDHGLDAVMKKIPVELSLPDFEQNNNVEFKVNMLFRLDRREGDLDVKCLPSEYVAHMFENVALSIGDFVRTTSFAYPVIPDLDAIIYGTKTVSSPYEYEEDEYKKAIVTTSDKNVKVQYELKKLSVGSCVNPVTITFVFTKDDPSNGLEFAVTESVELFNADGTLKYPEGYPIADTYTVTYSNSGQIEYKGLKWFAEESISTSGANAVSITAGSEVTVIPTAFFSFTSTRNIKLYTTLQNGKTYRRHLMFHPKNVQRINYSTASSNGLYQVKNGMLIVENIYDVLPLENLIANVGNVIVPASTATFISDEAMSFTLVNGWIPSEMFAKDDDATAFDIEKLKANLNSKGYSGILATGTIRGYNDEEQTIILNVTVKSLENGKLSHGKYAINDNKLVYDQYLYNDRDASGNGVFKLPKNVTVTFGDVARSFTVNDDLHYEIKNKATGEYSVITEITFDSMGAISAKNYGYEANDEITLKIVLPDGNDDVELLVTFPIRKLESVEYLSKKNATETALVNGIYFIDPYDKSTYALPTKGYFNYTVDKEVEQSVSWIAASDKEASAFTDGVYNGGDVGGALYLFHSELTGFGANDQTQYFILQVYVINRTFTKNSDVYKNEYKIDRPFDFYVKDSNPDDASTNGLPYELTGTNATFAELNKVLTDDEKASIKALVESFANATYNNVGDANVYGLIEGLTPVTPDVLWTLDGVELTNNDIWILGGFNHSLVGKVGYGEGEDRSVGSNIMMLIYASKWEFLSIEDIKDNIIDLDDFDNNSVKTEFRIKFAVENETNARIITFYATEEPANGNRILFNFDELKEDLQYSISLVNIYKDDAKNVFTSNKEFVFDPQKVSIDQINFYDREDTFGISGEVLLVIDPFNPIIPETASAKGSVSVGAVSGGGSNVINKEFDEVSVAWDDGIYSIPVNGGEKEVICRVYASAGKEFVFRVNVIYLDRTPQAYYTHDRGFTNLASTTLPKEAPDAIKNMGDVYELMVRTTASGEELRNFSFIIDPTPTNPNLYKLNASESNVTISGGSNKSKYVLPSSLVVRFAQTENDNSLAYDIIKSFSNYLYLENIQWTISRDITLVGTDVQRLPIGAIINSYDTEGVKNILYGSRYHIIEQSSELSKENTLELSLETYNRQVEYTYVLDANGNEVIVSSVPSDSVINYQQASDDYYIDPYTEKYDESLTNHFNLEFPSELYVKFANKATPYRATNIQWGDGEYINSRLSASKVINGQEAPELMYLMASFALYGTELGINFPIKPRYIATSVETGNGEFTTEPLSGGTLYVLSGEGAPAIKEQLPTRLYYRFDYGDSYEIASAPLSFEDAEINKINTSAVGRTYTVYGSLGLVDRSNIVFKVKVVAPVLQTVNFSQGAGGNAGVYYNGGFVYDRIPVGVNALGQYFVGPEQLGGSDKFDYHVDVMPYRVIVGEDGESMEITEIVYDMKEMKARVYCSYNFLSNDDSPEISSGRDTTNPASRQLTIMFSVPIETYNYTSVEIVSDIDFEDVTCEFELGEQILSSKLPKTESGIPLLWDVDGININRAGDYDATGYFVNAYGQLIKGTLKVTVKRRAIRLSNVVWVVDDQDDIDGSNDIDFLDRVYTGEELDPLHFINFTGFLREDGTYGTPENVTILYSIDGGYTWQKAQPVNVKKADAPEYWVRISINDADDYNYTNSVSYEMKIHKCEIDSDEIGFYVDETTGGTYENMDGNSWHYVFEYNGKEQKPAIKGIPQTATYQTAYKIEYAHYSAGNTNPVYADSIKPVNAGTYHMRLKFADEDNNFVIAVKEFTTIVTIKQKVVEYSLPQSVEYRGEAFDVPVNGLPEGLGDIYVEYNYYSIDDGQYVKTLRNAGRYIVYVRIDGGENYPDANLNETVGQGIGATGTAALWGVEVTVKKRTVAININTVESEYLDPLKALDSAMTLNYVKVTGEAPNQTFEQTDEPGLIGRSDSMKTFVGLMEVVWTGGTLTYKHSIGDYELDLVNKNITHRNYDFVIVNKGTYKIVAEQAIVINNAQELNDQIANLKDGMTVRWYLTANQNSYGTITINKNASVSIVGAYDVNVEGEKIAVKFDQIIVEKGAVRLDIIAFGDIANSAAVVVGEKVSSITVSRSEFKRNGTTVLTNSAAISTVYGFNKTVYVSESTFEGYQTAIYLAGGSLEMSDSSVENNMNGVFVQRGNVTLNNNKFNLNTGASVNVAYGKAVVSVYDNVFTNNNVAIKTSVALRNDIDVQNTFAQNGVTFEGWSLED